MARIDDTEIGGKEYGVVRLRALGNTTHEDMQAYESIGRQLLGDFKRELQLGGVKVGQRERKLPDGTLIRVMSNMTGPAHIDEIHIEKVRVSGGKKRCIGYIVQCVLDPAKWAGSFDDYKVRVTLPSGDDMRSAQLVQLDAIAGGDTSDGSFPDNGAKYVDLFEYDSGTSAYTTPTDYQAISVVIKTNAIVYEGLGPYVRTPAMNGAWAAGWGGTMNPGWSIVYSYNSNSGTCGVEDDPLDPNYGQPVTWDNTADPASNPIRVSKSFRFKATEVADSTSWAPGALYYSGGMTYVPLPLFPDRCDKDYPQAYVAGGGNNNERIDDWDSRSGAIFAAALNAASAEVYADDLSHYSNSSTSFYFWSYRFYSLELGKLYRRNDDKGLIVNTGWHFDNGIVLTKQDAGYGQTSVFMIPLGTQRKFRFYDGFAADVAAKNSSFDGYDTIGVAGEYGDLGGSHMSKAYANAAPQNLIDHHTTTNTPADTFGVPIKVESGTHTVEACGAGGDMYVWLLIQDDDNGETGFVRVKKDFTSTNLWPYGDEPNVRVKIKVGEFKNLGELYEFEQL